MRGDLHECYIIEHTLPEGEAAVTLTLDHPLPAQAGQFVMVWLPGLDEKPFSIMNDSPLALAVAIVGPFTTALSQKAIGDQIWVRGPYGHGFEVNGQPPLLIGGGSQTTGSRASLPARTHQPPPLIGGGSQTTGSRASLPARTHQRPLLIGGRSQTTGSRASLPARTCQRPLLIGGGSGAAPLVLLAKQMAPKVEEISVALGASTASRLMLAERFRAIGCRVHLATDDGSTGYAGTIVEAVTPLIEAKVVDTVYACGPEGMLINLAQLCINTGTPCQISLERYMRCGIGLCGSCHCGELLVCQDGPVIRADRWLEAISGSPRAASG